MVVISADLSRDELIECLHHFNQQAKAERRRGFAGVHGDRYKRLHKDIDDVLTAILDRDVLAGITAGESHHDL